MQEEFMNNKGELIVIKNNYLLKSEWQILCSMYLRKFCDKHKYTYEPDCWVANNPGTIACVNDMFVSMEDIRYDIDNDIPEEYFEKWYWKAVDVYSLTEQKYMNYSSFCQGAPDQWTEERLNSIREAKQRVLDAQYALEQEINKYKKE